MGQGGRALYTMFVGGLSGGLGRLVGGWGCLGRDCARFRELQKGCDVVGYGAPAFGRFSLIDNVVITTV